MASIDLTPVVPVLVPPTDREKSLHYCKLAGTLLARTSTRPLFPRGELWGFENFFRPIGPHPILSAWSDELARSIQKALDGIPWHRFYPIRLGAYCPMGCEWEGEGPKDGLILMVDILPGAAEFGPAITAALACRSLLNKAGVSDIEVEIREVRPRLLASFDDIIPVLEDRYWQHTMESKDTMDKLIPSLNDSLITLVPGNVGFEITSEREPSGHSGTMGPYIRLAGRDSELYGLTCRHVAHKPAAAPSDVNRPWFWLPNDQGYNYETPGVPVSPRMIQPGSSAVEALKDKLEELCRKVEQRRMREDILRSKHFGSGTDEPWPNQSVLDDLNHDHAYYEKLLGLLNEAPIALEPTRSFGQIAFMSPLEVSARGFFRDWALIRLDQDNARPAPINSIVLGKGLPNDLNIDNVTNTRPRSFMLSGSVWSSDRVNQRQSVKVAKRGRTTGFTVGVTNEIKAVVRHPGSEDSVAWEWIVVHEQVGRDYRFSHGGDSGACVFDMNGDVVGLVTSGNVQEEVLRRWKKYTVQDESLPVDSGQASDKVVPPGFTAYDQGTDLSFVTPIDKLFEDIEKVTGYKPRLA